jgi:GTP-binding protein EngB required for normal cell division
MTKTINHYLVNDSWYLVDLPGYGFAKASRGTQGSWLGFTKEYFLKRDALVAVLLLVDAAVAPQPVDLECADWLAESEVGVGGVWGEGEGLGAVCLCGSPGRPAAGMEANSTKTS